ncbi:hypothetical protein B0H10DRAFT_1951287 [Mycena sp. CBHHK59/15]|nr:hypothetical protein B0H10DRAFT_1959339 [Mycena sp. CBHHK59/15]KAJ6613770.1 hypothetical protein B0H10DRAFT_1951287 [Mycena sp. CBHHK59/15]
MFEAQIPVAMDPSHLQVDSFHALVPKRRPAQKAQVQAQLHLYARGPSTPIEMHRTIGLPYGEYEHGFSGEYWEGNRLENKGWKRAGDVHARPSSAAYHTPSPHGFPCVGADSPEYGWERRAQPILGCCSRKPTSRRSMRQAAHSALRCGRGCAPQVILLLQRARQAYSSPPGPRLLSARRLDGLGMGACPLRIVEALMHAYTRHFAMLATQWRMLHVSVVNPCGMRVQDGELADVERATEVHPLVRMRLLLERTVVQAVRIEPSEVSPFKQGN